MTRLVILASIAMLALFSCSHDERETSGRVRTQVKIAILDSETKAGNLSVPACSVNRYILEVYHAGSRTLYQRVEQSVQTGTELTQIPVELLVGADYYFVVWADTAASAGRDLYYDTSSERGLRGVRRIAHDRCNDDDMDAFCGCELRTAGSDLGEVIWLRRPFAQLRILTSDMTDIHKQKLLPQQVCLHYWACDEYDCLIQSACGPRVEFSMQEKPYYQLSGQDESTGPWILALDYIFAPREEAELSDIGFSVLTGADPVPWCRFENIPLRANYRTNISGAILTMALDYDVRVSPGWDGEL